MGEKLQWAVKNGDLDAVKKLVEKVRTQVYLICTRMAVESSGNGLDGRRSSVARVPNITQLLRVGVFALVVFVSSQRLGRASVSGIQDHERCFWESYNSV